jgi:hypothetical protein
VTVSGSKWNLVVLFVALGLFFSERERERERESCGQLSVQC